MKREEEIIDAGIEYTMSHNPVCIGGGAFADEMREFNRSAAFEAGAKWADEHPNRNSVYTKQELRDMGFGFDLNGNIVTLDEMEEMAKRGHEYRKSRLIKKAVDWLSENAGHYIVSNGGGCWYDSVRLMLAFRKVMEE